MKKLIFIFIASLLCPALRAQDSLYFRAGAWREQLEEYYRADAQQFPEKGSILFVGSSSIRMWHDLPASFPGHRVLARGFGGAWMSDVLYHMQRLVLDYKPAQIVLYAGENDLANGIKPEAVVEDVKCFVRMAEIHLPGVPVVILSVKPSPQSHRVLPKQRQVNAQLYDFSQQKPLVTFVDISTLMYDGRGALRGELYRTDSLHVTDQAYRLWQQAIEPHLIQNK